MEDAAAAVVPIRQSDRPPAGATFNAQLSIYINKPQIREESLKYLRAFLTKRKIKCTRPLKLAFI